MITEDQARKKWCPFSRVAHSAGFVGATSFNRIPGTPPSAECTGCIASDCMAWIAAEQTFDIAKDRFLIPGESYSSRDPNYEQRPNGKGWCGHVRGLD
ncbi:hypothetical protein FV232_01065 [Methylobacterium sp. WL30]|uniref:hypothetical protein n=1 Tax=unclassified Methylobacterium TaxID=2615210 RepID=UPI0011C88C02|nr:MULTISPECIES: hypothetical protein [unclassified Methylobacterium]TXN38750.1 hypothetical protein FV225_12665 [Methylobacterium sp. WL93]TXN52244.1 hypothetical protein FV227_04105 [Methylobacterium sp. WL119]TXN70673.1 hypothetical protein FV232_01065 [Methylobacterium sp. WL30]